MRRPSMAFGPNRAFHARLPVLMLPNSAPATANVRLTSLRPERGAGNLPLSEFVSGEKHAIMTTKPGLGIDFGGVIIPTIGQIRGEDTQFSGDFRATPPNRGAVEEIRALVAAFHGNVWIVSKAGPRMQTRTLNWIHHQDFSSRTGLNETHVRFCRECADKQPICADLGITHFVDDRVHVM